MIVAPDTVLRWQRRRFREHWTKISRRRTGRPPVNAGIKVLVTRMVAANPRWGAPRIHGELLKLGFDAAERTVSRLIPKRRTPPSQTWHTFLTTTSGIWSLSISPFLLLTCASSSSSSCSPHRRRVMHFNVDRTPTASWTAQQIVEAFPDDTAPS